MCSQSTELRTLMHSKTPTASNQQPSPDQLPQGFSDGAPSLPRQVQLSGELGLPQGAQCQGWLGIKEIPRAVRRVRWT